MEKAVQSPPSLANSEESTSEEVRQSLAHLYLLVSTIIRRRDSKILSFKDGYVTMTERNVLGLFRSRTYHEDFSESDELGGRSSNSTATEISEAWYINEQGEVDAEKSTIERVIQTKGVYRRPRLKVDRKQLTSPPDAALVEMLSTELTDELLRRHQEELAASVYDRIKNFIRRQVGRLFVAGSMKHGGH